MIPLRDNIPSRTTPFLNYTVIALCALMFLAQLRSGRDDSTLVERLGMIPRRIVQPDAEIEVPRVRTVEEPRIVETPRGPRRVFPGDRVIVEEPAAEPPFHPWLTLLTCMFLHGGWLHFLGNMWFLHIFGDNVEDRFGHLGFLLLYLGTGVAASAAQIAVNPDSTVPTIGASGAIAGVMGAYLVLYPRAYVLTLVPIFLFIQILVLPAPLFLGVWFLIQFFQGTFAVGTNVAWWAHIGGFVAGAAVAWLLGRGHKLRPPVDQRLPHSDHATAYRYRRRPPGRW